MCILTSIFSIKSKYESKTGIALLRISVWSFQESRKVFSKIKTVGIKIVTSLLEANITPRQTLSRAYAVRISLPSSYYHYNKHCCSTPSTPTHYTPTPKPPFSLPAKHQCTHVWFLLGFSSSTNLVGLNETFG